MNDSALLTKIPYKFQDSTLLKMALTHPSSSRSQKVSDFERLEFLGDRVLGLVIAKMVYERYPKEKEGDLAKRFAALVCREACLEIAHQMNLSTHLIASLGDITPNSALLADAVEALIGAIYLDGGIEAASTVINAYWPALLEKDISPPKDPKTALQELAQSKNLGVVPSYEVLDHSGPAHTPTFTVRVSVEGLGEAIGTGASKRQAEQMAAKKLLDENTQGE
ncbi:MAG: ribonuclease III [Alphaproteobacteria bacterium]|jgi:ribonuclease-3|nr:ribonuclease III [Alphaproteobacteria bacterium]